MGRQWLVLKGNKTGRISEKKKEKENEREADKIRCGEDPGRD